MMFSCWLFFCKLHQFALGLDIRGIRISFCTFLKLFLDFPCFFFVTFSQQGADVLCAEDGGKVFHGLHKSFLLPGEQFCHRFGAVLGDKLHIDPVAEQQTAVQTRYAAVQLQQVGHQAVSFFKLMPVHQAVAGEYAYCGHQAVFHRHVIWDGKPLLRHVFQPDAPGYLAVYL